MADSFIQVAPDSTGRKLQTFRNTIAGNDVDSEAVVLVGPDGVPLITNPLNALFVQVYGYDGSAPRLLHTDVNGRLELSGDSEPINVRIDSAGSGVGKLEDVPSADADGGVPAMAIRKATPANTSDTDGDYEMLQMDGGKLWVKGPLTDTELRASPVPISGSFSLPTGAATEAKQDTQITDLGGVTETAPASDTASSGLNGRLQRIAQRITSFIALLPASLGQKTKANSLAVTLASDSDTLPVSGPLTDTQLRASAVPVSLASVPSHAVTNAGTFAVQATIAAGAAAIGKAEDAASADADVGVPSMAIQKTTPADLAGTDGDYAMLQMKNGLLFVDGSKVTQPISAAALPLPSGAANKATQTDGSQRVQVTDGTTNAAVKAASTAAVAADPALVVAISPNNSIAVVGTKPITSTNSPTLFQNLGANATLNVKASAGNVFSLTCYNANAAARYLQLHNTATVPAGSAVPVFSFLVPPSGQIIIGTDFFTNEGCNFATGIAFAFSTARNIYTAATAGDQSTWIQYK